MTDEQKYTAIACVIPVIADLLEDLNEDFFKQHIKVASKNLIAQIRRLDEFLMDKAPLEDIENQIDAQLSFRNWVKENFVE